MRGPAILFALVGVAVALGAAPGLTWLDGGELGAAAAELGVAHPPGFPLFALLHKAAMLLVPLGDVAFRGNVASGLLGAAALVGAIATARSFGVRRGDAWAGAALVALTPLWALHSLTIEVYTGAAAWCAAVALCVSRAARDDDARYAVAAAFAVGLALGHHAELRLFALCLVPGALVFGRRRPRAAGWGAVAGLLGALVALYLPLRAAAGPWRNWGDPSSPARLWAHLSGARIRAAYADQFGAFDPDAFATFGAQLVTGAPFLLALGAAGLLLLARRPGGAFVAALWAADALYATLLNPMGLKDLQNGVPGLLALGIGAAVSLEALARRLPWRGPAQAVAVGALLAAAALVALPGASRAPDRGLPLILDGLSDSLPPDGMALVVSDHYAAGLAFRQVVEGDRPDVAGVVRQHAWDPSAMNPVQARRPLALAGWRPEGGLASLQALRRGWPLQWEWASGADAAHRPADLWAAFPFTAVGQRSGRRYTEVSDQVADALPPGGLSFPEAQQAFSDLVADQGHALLFLGDAKRAAAAFEMARVLAPGAVRHLNNAAQAWLRAGRLDRALGLARSAYSLAPDDGLTVHNLARMLVSAGQGPAARAVLDARLADHEDATAYGLRGVARGNAGDLAGAAADFKAAIALDPQQAEALGGLARLRAMQAQPPGATAPPPATP